MKDSRSVGYDLNGSKVFHILYLISAIWLGPVGFVKHVNLLRKHSGGEVENHVKICQKSNVFSKADSFTGSLSKISYHRDDMKADF